jgi:hypothetical protein
MLIALVTADLHTQSMATFMICLQTKYNTPMSNCSFVTNIKPNERTTISHSTFYERLTRKTCYHIPFTILNQKVLVSLLHHKFACTPCCYRQLWENKLQNVLVASTGFNIHITFRKISYTVRTLDTDTRTVIIQSYILSL